MCPSHESLNEAHSSSDDLSLVAVVDLPADLATTFFTAAERRDYKALKQCLKTGVDPNIFRNDFTVLHISAMNGDVILLEYMIRLKTIDINVRTLDSGMTALHLATRNQQIAVVKILLKYGADIEARNANGKRPMHMAALTANMTMLKVLLHHKPQLNVIDTFSQTPLSIAVLDRLDYTVAELLCKNDAKPDLPRPSSIPLLFEAILNHHAEHYMELIKLLVDYGSDVNEVDANGRNALHYAAIVGHEDLVKFLDNNHCDGEQMDLTGRSPIHYATMHGNHVIAKYISDKYTIDLPPIPRRSVRSSK